MKRESPKIVWSYLSDYIFEFIIWRVSYLVIWEILLDQTSPLELLWTTKIPEIFNKHVRVQLLYILSIYPSFLDWMHYFKTHINIFHIYYSWISYPLDKNDVFPQLFKSQRYPNKVTTTLLIFWYWLWKS